MKSLGRAIRYSRIAKLDKAAEVRRTYDLDVIAEISFLGSWSHLLACLPLRGEAREPLR